MLGLKLTADNLARTNGVRWYGHFFRRPEKDVLIKKKVHEVDRKRKQGRPKTKWRKQVEESMRRIGLKKEDVADRCRWREGVGRVSEIIRCIRPPPYTGKI